MVRYFILIKRKNSKRYLGAIPARSGISLSVLRESAKKQIKPGFAYRIITESQLKRILPKLLKRPKSGGITMKKRSSRSKPKRKMKRKPKRKAKRVMKRKRKTVRRKPKRKRK